MFKHISDGYSELYVWLYNSKYKEYVCFRMEGLIANI